MVDHPTPSPSSASSADPRERPHYVTAALRSLTSAERRHVLVGYIGDPFRMDTLRSLRRKGLFYLKITSPNGQCGFMELTPLGVTVQGILQERKLLSVAT